MNDRTRIFLYVVYKIGLYIFAVIGLVLVAGFLAVRWHWTDVQGAIDVNDSRFQIFSSNKKTKSQTEVLGAKDHKDSSDTSSIDGLDAQIKQLSEKKEQKAKNYCLIDIIGQNSPQMASEIIKIYKETDSEILVSKMILAARIRIEEKNGKNVFTNCETKNIPTDDEAIEKKYLGVQGSTLFPWMDNEQWITIKDAIIKDKEIIEKASSVAGVEPRLLVSCAIVEQVRLFHASRELFKKFFEPLKILGNANKISLGVMGIKENTAIQIQEHLKDSNSPYYLGTAMERTLDFENGSDNNLYNRLTEETHYYSYLYGAVYLKQIMTQWEKAGYDIKYRPEIAGTLFNVGFPQSKPNPTPKVGGSEINVDGTKYTFGSLAYEFYYSGELLEVFPYRTN